MKKAVVLLSGGVDSAVALAIAMHKEFEAYAMSFDYGQRHIAELGAATSLVNHLGLADRHCVIKLDPRPFSGSALTDGVEVPNPIFPSFFNVMSSLITPGSCAL